MHRSLRFALTLTAAPLLAGIAVPTLADDWPQWGGPRRDIVWRETGIVETLPAEGKLMPRMWSTPVGEGYAGPAVAAGRVYITDLVNRRGGRGTERVQCLDADTGKVQWTHEYPVTYTISYPAGPRATPTVDGDRVYTVGAVGDLFCLDTETGKVVWKKNFPEDYQTNLPTWGMAAAPLVDGRQLIVLVGGANGALVVSFDKTSGKELWRALDDPEIGYSPPVIYEYGGRRELIIWHPSAISALDPQSGKVLWEVPFQVQAGLTAPMPRRVGDDRLFVTSFYNGPRMVQVSDDGTSAKVLWRGNSDSEKKTDKLHSIIPTPLIKDGCIFGVCSYGQLRCLDVKTGERIWETFAATGQGRWWNAFLIENGDRTFLCNEQGDLIIARLNRDGYHEISRAKLIEPTRQVQRRMTIWSHPAFAMKSIFARNDNEIVRVNLASGK